VPKLDEFDIPDSGEGAFASFCFLFDCYLVREHLKTVTLQVEWRDIEAIIGFYGERHLFVGDRRIQQKDWAKRHMLAAGVSPSVYPQDSRSTARASSSSILTRVHTSRTSGRLLKLNTPLLTVLRQRYSLENGKRGTSMVLRDMEIALNALKSHPKTSRRADRISKHWDKQRSLAPVDALFAILRGIQSEELQLQFDFVAFNMRCFEFLRRLRDRLNQKMPGIQWSATVGNQNMETVVTTIFGITVDDDDTSRQCLGTVAECASEMIGREGAKEMEAAEVRSLKSSQ
jgi:hypothetical protein